MASLSEMGSGYVSWWLHVMVVQQYSDYFLEWQLILSLTAHMFLSTLHCPVIYTLPNFSYENPSNHSGHFITALSQASMQ